MFRNILSEAPAFVFGFTISFGVNLLIGAFIALVFLSYWGWFIEPLGIPRIGFFHAWGLIVMAGLVIPRPQVMGDAEVRWEHAKNVLIVVAFSWPFGFLLNLLSS